MPPLIDMEKGALVEKMIELATQDAATETVLRAEVRDLKAELATARETIKRLEADLSDALDHVRQLRKAAPGWRRVPDDEP